MNLSSLLAASWLGALYASLLFVLCFVTVHIIRLARRGYQAMRNLPPEKPTAEKPAEEPVYYIVEKKKKRSKSEYSEPKRISFKD